MRSFITYVLNIFPCFLISTICCDIKASIQFSHFLSFHCLSVKLCNELVAKNYLITHKLTFAEECSYATYEAELSTPMIFSFSYVRKQTKHQRQNSLISSSWRLGFLGGGRALFIISWKAPDLCHFPIQNLSFAKKSVLNSQSVVSASWWPK